MTPIVLYTTLGCHLCELALQQIVELKQTYTIQLTEVEIGDDDRLVAKYGIRIPVLEFADGSELEWPFEVMDIRRHLDVT